MRDVVPPELARRTLADLEAECCGALFFRSVTENKYECSKCDHEITVADFYREAMNRNEGYQTMDREQRRAEYAKRKNGS